MRLKPSPFAKIASKRKTIELRLFDEKRQMIHPGDEIVFTNLRDPEQKLLVRVLQLHCYPSFEELYHSLPLLKCGYTEKSLPTAKAEDMEQYYSREQQEKYGVVGIEIEVEED